MLRLGKSGASDVQVNDPDLCWLAKEPVRVRLNTNSSTDAYRKNDRQEKIDQAKD